MRVLIPLTMLFSSILPAAPLEAQGWRKQEQSGATAYLQGNDAMILVAPPKTFNGSFKSAYEKAVNGFLGGKIISGGSIQELEADTFFSEYEVQEQNGTRTFRAALAFPKEGMFQALLFAANDAASYQKHRATALSFFDQYRGAASAPAASMPVPSSQSGALLGEWYTGSISIIQYRNQFNGMLAPPAGNNMFYHFKQDGSYEQYGVMQFNYGACTNSYFMNLSGRYELKGDVLTLTPAQGTYDSRTCGGSPVRKNATLTPSTFRIQIARGELKTFDAEGRSSTFRRK